MGLESGNFVNDLNASNPVGGTDDINQGDDHLRLIKTVLRNTFIGFTRAFHFPAAGSAKTGAYAVLLTDQNALIRGDMTSGGFTITLPLGSVVFTGYEVTVMKSDSSVNVLTVDGAGSETIAGSTTRPLIAQYSSETYRWEGSEWKIVAEYNPLTGNGTSIASASTITIGLDGQIFTITGTDTIATMTVAAGRFFILVFASTAELTNSSSLLLPGGADITAAAGDVAYCFATAADTVKVFPYVPADGAAVVDDDTAATGTVIQVLNSSVNAVSTGTTILPNDDTIPQNTEGDEYITLAITPGATDNNLLISVVLYCALSITGDAVVALFQDSTAGALAAAGHRQASDPVLLVLDYFMAAGTTSETTFKVRAGPASSATFTLNGALGVRDFGGVAVSSITITEIKG